MKRFILVPLSFALVPLAAALAAAPAAKPDAPAARNAPAAAAPAAGAKAAAVMDPALRDKARAAVDLGLHWLRGTQAENGSWSGSVGVTAIALRGYLESYRHYTEADGAFITRPVQFILSHANEDGSICETQMNRSYSTATAIVALQATGNPAYREVIKRAQKFLTGHQVDEGEGYDPKHPYYGGVGYGGDERPDLSNHYMALEALRASDFDPKDPAWEKALRFASRCQNRSESNDQPWAGNDGGFTYMAGESPHAGTRSYGGMTSAGLVSLLFAGVDRKDPRVAAAYDWIRQSYTLEKNPGAADASGLYYYYLAFAQCMAAYGDPTITLPDGSVRNWRDDLVRKLTSLQDKEGWWVNAQSPRWWEGDKNLTTARMVVALDLALR